MSSCCSHLISIARPAGWGFGGAPIGILGMGAGGGCGVGGETFLPVCSEGGGALFSPQHGASSS